MNLLKKFLLNIFLFFGFELKIKKKDVKSNNFNSIIKFLLKIGKEKSDVSKNIFFDVGANIGQSIERFKEIDNNSITHSFEPTPLLYKELVERYKGKNSEELVINNFGLSDTSGELYLNSFKYHKINSFLEIDKNSKFAKSRIMNYRKLNENENFKTKFNYEDNDNFADKIKTKVKTIDDYCKTNNIKKINYMKIDTQGFEDKVLMGAEEMLESEKIDIIELELILGYAYMKQLTFLDIEKILNKYSYKLAAINNGGNIISFSNFQTELIYVKKGFYEELKNYTRETSLSLG